MSHRGTEKQFHGKLAANGEVFDMTANTATHRKLPLGSIVRVRNLGNGKNVQDRNTDRGPYVMGRMLDLSHAAARALGIDKGTATVQLEVIGAHRGLWSVPPPQSIHLALTSASLPPEPAVSDRCGITHGGPPSHTSRRVIRPTRASQRRCAARRLSGTQSRP